MTGKHFDVYSLLICIYSHIYFLASPPFPQVLWAWQTKTLLLKSLWAAGGTSFFPTKGKFDRENQA